MGLGHTSTAAIGQCFPEHRGVSSRPPGPWGLWAVTWQPSGPPSGTLFRSAFWGALSSFSRLGVVSWLFRHYLIDPLSGFISAGSVSACFQGWDLTVPVTKMAPVWSEKAAQETWVHSPVLCLASCASEGNTVFLICEVGQQPDPPPGVGAEEKRRQHKENVNKRPQNNTPLPAPPPPEHPSCCHCDGQGKPRALLGYGFLRAFREALPSTLGSF